MISPNPIKQVDSGAEQQAMIPSAIPTGMFGDIM
jgi:hypothetical protein